MKTICLLLSLYCATVAYAQQSQLAATGPKLVRFSGSFRPANGSPAQTMESVTLSVYRDQTGGDSLWHEVQNVVVDSDRHYSVLMGATKNEGMPLDLFTSAEPRWLGVQFNRPGEAEQPRTLLVSVPYALKSVDADTLGGKPASAYLLAAPSVGADTARTSSATVAKPKAAPANSGQPNYIGKFANTTDLIDSAMYEVNGNVGIFTTLPAISLDVRTGSLPQMGIAGKTDYLTFFASDQYGPAIYWDPAKDMRFGKGGSGLYNPFGFVEQMRIKSSNGNVGIGTQTPGSKLDVAGDINFTGGVRYQGSPVLQISSSSNYTALGLGALLSNTSGLYSSAVGAGALASNTTGNQNTAIGYLALQANNAGTANTAIGNGALTLNTTGNFNTAEGDHALYNNTTGLDNTATGQGALFSNIIGKDNTANGYLALMSSTDDANTATGAYALQNSTGTLSTASGAYALQNNTTGDFNTASGAQALFSNTIGDQNTAIGYQALYGNIIGRNNTAIGAATLGFLTSGGDNIAIGIGAGENVRLNNNIEIGSLGTLADNGVIRIGDSAFQVAFFAAGVRGVTTNFGDAIPVLVDSRGQLGTTSSSRRFKEDIQDMGAASYDLMRLRPVTYRYKQPFADGTKPIQYGLIAEEVAEVYPDLVAHSADGQIETVKYQVLDSMLLNEMQRQRAVAEHQESEIVSQKDQIRRLEQRNQSLEERLTKLEAALASQSGVARISATQ